MERLLLFVLALVAMAPPRAAARPPGALASYKGSEFEGGAKDLFGSDFDGEQVNYVYAEPTGKHSKMQVKFILKAVPPGPLFVHLRARDDDGPKQCTIAIELNGKTLFTGPNSFPARNFTQQKFAVPEGVLVVGENRLLISNREGQGIVGMPPWFQVAACVIGPATYSIPIDLHKDFWVSLPKEKRPIPEPLPEGQAPGFKWRGTKGWMWTPKQYLAEIPVLARYHLNFLMNCYTSMCDVDHYPWGNSKCNRWWEPLPPEKKRAYEEVVRECQRRQVQFCFSMNPNLSSERFVNDGKPESLNQLFQHYAWMQGLGVKWFNISLDDISAGIDAAGQARVVNEILHRLRARDSEAQMIFCPTFYWGDGTGKDQQPYLEILARQLDPAVYLFWTGDSVVGTISRKGADTFRRLSGHRLFLWDNYPVNDNQPTMHLGPIIDRDPDLCVVIDGYMSNPMCTQNEINRIPLLTCLDYAWNPTAYDPLRSVGQAIVHLADTPAQQEVLRDLVEAYPGMLICGHPSTGFNAVQDQFQQIVRAPQAHFAAEAYLERLHRLSARMHQEFPQHYQAAKRTLDDDIARLQKRLSAKYTNPE